MNPLAMTGPSFLVFLSIMFAASILLSLLLRRLAAGPGDAPDPRALRELHPYEVAYLAGGPDAAVNAAVGSLYHREALTVVGRALRASSTAPCEPVHAVDRALLDVLRPAQQLDAVQGRARVTASLRDGLVRRGLAITAARELQLKLAAALPFVLLFALGIVRLARGASAGRPVLFLIFLLIAAAFGACFWLARSWHRSVRGDQALALLQRRNAALKTAAAARSDGLGGEDVALAIGLFGLAAIAGGPLQPLHQAIAPPPAAGGSCGGSSCGGGCGGGGCGGCGG